MAKKLTASKVDLIIFTGSTEKGRLIAAAASKNLTPCILELGGKCPVVIDSSADLEYSAIKVAMNAFMNSGQTCIRPDYCLVQYEQATKFIELLSAQIKLMFEKDKNFLGKVVNQFHTNRLCKLLADHKGTVVVGNAAAHEDGNLVPTVVLNPAEDCPLMSEEIFGPILGVFTFKKLDEAIKLINSKPKALAVYYFGTNSNKNENLTRLQRETSSGAFMVNEMCFQIYNPDLPFGGVGDAGYGRLHGKDGFDSCTNPKSVIRKGVLKFYPFNVMFPPYTPDKQQMVRTLAARLNISQRALQNRVILFLVALWLLWLVATKRLTLKTFKKFWTMLKMMWAFMRK